MSAYVRPMRREDIAQVAEIDREAFPTEWTRPNFKHELRNRLAYYIVACDTEQTVDRPKVAIPPSKGLSGLVSRVRDLFIHSRSFSGVLPTPSRQYIVGFAGFWIMADEAHITTIATRKVHRRQGIGELLLISIIEQATRLNARIITLEVRVSNTTAQRLYSKYGFTQVEVRRGYYTDNKEDAILMSTKSITSAPFQTRLKQLKQAYTMKRETAHYQAEC